MDTKALRQKILDLAIRGKLVPQNPNDEPASVLLDRIRAEKQQMVKDGKLKAKDLKNDTIIFVGDDNLHYEKFSDGSVKCIESEIPFDIPNGWEWSRLSTICYKLTDGTHHSPNNFPSGDFKYITAKNIKESGIDLTEITYVEAKVHKEIFARCNPEYGDVLYIKDGATSGIATVNNLNEAFSLLSSVALLKPAKGIDSWYMCNAMQSSYFYNTTREDMKGVGITRITLSMLSSRLIPIPPSIEQNRIAQKFRSLICIINGVETDKELLKEAIQLLKNKILDLAIRGKLVSQNPNDESASVLLERIHQEKEELIKAGKLKRDKRESIIFRGDDNSYYLRTGKLVEALTDWSFDDLPKNWEICCFGEICNYGDCINVESSEIENVAWILDLEDIEKDTGQILSRVNKDERPSISTKHKFHKGQVLYSKLRPYLNKVVLADQDGYCTSEILPLEFHPVITAEYARYYLMSPTFLRYANKCSYGVKMPRLGTNDGKKAIFPLPPVSEQKRIVKQIEFMFSHLNVIENCIQ